MEHILPKSPQHWNGWAGFNEVDGSEWIHRIGNLTLMGPADNRPGKKYNDNFAKKRREAYQDSSIMLTRRLSQYDDWNPTNIEIRQREMAKLAVCVWKFVLTPDLRDLRRLAENQLGVPATLHNYQWEGVAFLYSDLTPALLADEMGLGKTVQTSVALALLLNGQSEIRRVLIVAPASLTINWMMELSTWAAISSGTARTGYTHANAKRFIYCQSRFL